MRRSHIWLCIAAAFVLLISTGIVYFLWKDSRPLPTTGQVESRFGEEIRALHDLTAEIDPDDLSHRPWQALSGSRLDEVQVQLSESGIVSAAVNFRHPGSRNSILVVHDDSLNLWSPILPPESEGSYVTFCYSGLRQLIRYERITRTVSGQSVGFEIVFPSEELNENE